MTTTKKTAKTEMPEFDPTAAFAPEKFKEGYEKFAENVSVFTDFQKNSIEAVMASANAFARGVEKINAEQSAFAKAAFENSVATAKAATTSNSVQEAIELNSDFVRESIEKNIGQVNKVADIWMETTKETVEPLSARYNELVEKIQAYRP